MTLRPVPRLPTRGGHADARPLALQRQGGVEWRSFVARCVVTSAASSNRSALVVALVRTKSASTVSSVSDLIEVMTRVTGGSTWSSTSQYPTLSSLENLQDAEGVGSVGRSLEPSPHTMVSCSFDAELGSTTSVDCGPNLSDPVPRGVPSEKGTKLSRPPTKTPPRGAARSRRGAPRACARPRRPPRA